MTEPWVLIAGGFHARGAMDKANAAVADYLLSAGHKVHLVCHDADERFHRHAQATVHISPRPLGSILLGEFALDSAGRRVATAVRRHSPSARIVANGGNCISTDINWVHCVHNAWPCADTGAPAWFRLKNHAAKQLARRRERTAFQRARTLVANSARTQQDLMCVPGVDPERIRVVQLGSDKVQLTRTEARSTDAFRALDIPLSARLAVFVGALSYDNNKGFDTLWKAWQRVHESGNWDVYLAVLGSGSGLNRWKQLCSGSDAGERIRFVGFTERVQQIVAASDLLISPSRYESYGLNVHEALCCDVPVIVTACAGVADQISNDLRDLLLQDAGSESELAHRLVAWSVDQDRWSRAAEQVGRRLRQFTWSRMAEEFVRIVQAEAQPTMTGVQH